MTFNTILLLLLSVLFAGGLSFFQYFYKSKINSKTTFTLASLRFLAILGLLVLLINPIITRNSLEVVKTPLPIFFDNSASISYLKANSVSKALFEKLNSNTNLKTKFEIQNFAFDSGFQTITKSNELNFKGKQTALDLVAKNLKSIFKNKQFPTILISDGNQTSGSDYVFSFDSSKKIFPIIIGDTTKFLDIKISQINANKYAFLKNKFPIEVFLDYSGSKPIVTSFEITQNNTVISKQNISFSSEKKTQVIEIVLPANSKGLQKYTAVLKPISGEKNTYNNVKKFAVDILDQKTEIALISSFNHPDLGAFKRSIETNLQRKVTLLQPQDIKDLSKFNVLILYQPNATFKTIFENNKIAKRNTFIITGITTDFNFLNQVQNQVLFKMTSQKEDYLTAFETDFNLFSIENISFESFPPLENLYGTIVPNQKNSILLSSKIRNISTEQPLLMFTDYQGLRTTFLFGEGSWKWRSHSFVKDKSFDKYDLFIDKIIQFLASNDTKKALVVNHERFYDSGEPIEIEAQFFNKNYEFDEKARLTIEVKNNKSKKVKKYDFLKSNTSFKVNLDGLEAGFYSFLVKELNSNTTYASNFEILDFDIEKQFVNADLFKLRQLSAQTNGFVSMPNQVDQLIKILITDESFNPIQKNIIIKTPLINWIWLLIFIAACLILEWFIRKYNGML